MLATDSPENPPPNPPRAVLVAQNGELVPNPQRLLGAAECVDIRHKKVRWALLATLSPLQAPHTSYCSASPTLPGLLGARAPLALHVCLTGKLARAPVGGSLPLLTRSCCACCAGGLLRVPAGRLGDRLPGAATVIHLCLDAAAGQPDPCVCDQRHRRAVVGAPPGGGFTCCKSTCALPALRSMSPAHPTPSPPPSKQDCSPLPPPPLAGTSLPRGPPPRAPRCAASSLRWGPRWARCSSAPQSSPSSPS